MSKENSEIPHNTAIIEVTPMQSIILTGATSMLGIALIQSCLKRGTRVTALVRENSQKLAALPDSPLLTVHPCELDNLKNLLAGPLSALGILQSAQNADAFYHLAWGSTSHTGREDARAQAANIDTTLDAAELAARLSCKRLVGAGSQAEYGRKDHAIREDEPVAPETAYGAAKYAAGKLSAQRCAELGMEHVWTRIFSVYGPYNAKSTMVMSVIGTLLKGETPALTPCGQMWDYLYSADAGEALYLAGEKGQPGKTYNIGSGAIRPLSEYVEELKNTIDPALKLGIGQNPYSPKQVMHLLADITALKEDTGFAPQTSFEEGIAKTIQWYREEIL